MPLRRSLRPVGGHTVIAKPVRRLADLIENIRFADARIGAYGLAIRNPRPEVYYFFYILSSLFFYSPSTMQIIYPQKNCKGA
jgi:hypothetical protein